MHHRNFRRLDVAMLAALAGTLALIAFLVLCPLSPLEAAARRADAEKLRKELASAVAAESVIRGQQVNTERSQRRGETAELFESRERTYDSLLNHKQEIEKLI